MNAVDQLRAAADAFTARADRDVRYYKLHGEQHPSTCFSCGEDRATAALLRAVADAHDKDEDMCQPGWTDPVHTAALALASAILGKQDE